MPQTIYGNQVGTETLRAGDTLTVTVDAGTGGIVEQYRGGTRIAGTPISTTTSFGPFVDDMMMRVSAYAGATLTTNTAEQNTARSSDAAAAAVAALVAGAGKAMAHAVQPAGYASVSAATAVTRHAVIYVPFIVRAVRLRALNAHSSTYSGLTALIGTADNLTNGAAPSSAWTSVTWDGGQSTPASAIAAATGTSPNFTALGSTLSDVIYIEPAAYDGVGTVLHVRTYQPNANGTRLDSAGAAPELALAKCRASYHIGADGVTTPAGYTPTYSGSFPPVELICYSSDQIVPVVIGGASTMSGQGDGTGHLGMFWRAAQQVTGKAIAIDNTAIPSSTTAASLLRTLAAVSRTLPRYAVWGGFSTNDSDEDTSAGLTRMLGQHRYFIDECRRVDCWPILATFQASTGMSGTQNANRKTANADMRALAAAGRCGLIDVAGLLTDETQATGAWVSASYTDDGIHPSVAGHALCASNAVLPVFQAML